MKDKTRIVKNGTFSDALHDCRMSKAELAEELGVHPGTVSNWGDEPPRYVLAFLRERKRVLELRQAIFAKDGKP